MQIASYVYLTAQSTTAYLWKDVAIVYLIPYL